MADKRGKLSLGAMFPFIKASTFEDGELLDLLCPKCGCDKIYCKDGNPDLGNDARCYECGHEFIITGNCWRRI